MAKLHSSIYCALRSISDQLSVNHQLIVAHDNFVHYRKWAEAKIAEAYRVIEHQRIDLEELHRRLGKDDWLSAYYGHLST